MNPYYKENGITIYNGDCFNVLPLLSLNITMVLTDPPYAITNMVLTDPPYAITNCKWDNPIDLTKMWRLLPEQCKDNAAFVFTASQPFTSRLVCSNLNWFKYEMIWEKDNASNFLHAKKQVLKYHENIIVFYNKQCKYYPIKWDAGRVSNRRGRDATKRLKKDGYINDTLDNVSNYCTTRYPKSIIKFNVPKHNTEKKISSDTKTVGAYEVPDQNLYRRK